MSVNPLSGQEFDGLISALGPFEAHPHLAIAVSGGADSMALTLLADQWVRQRGGWITGLSVDHGLRRESATEAHQVGAWLAARKIDHQVLTWKGRKPKTGLQSAARAARYGLLEDWCSRAGVLHLLLAHQLEDQAETFLLRLQHDSGINGLAAMSSIIETRDSRRLRPLLTVPKARLLATLEAASQSWIEDPSNDNPAFERVRIRQSFPMLSAAGISAVGLATTARRMARARIALEAEVSRLLAHCCVINPAGYAHIDARSLFSSADEISLRAVSRMIQSIGGGDYPPRLAKLERLHEKMKAAFHDASSGWKGATLARCRVLSMVAGKDKAAFLVCREERGLPAPMPLLPGAEMNWDQRFDVHVEPWKELQHQGLSLQPLGRKNESLLVSTVPEIRARPVPPVVWASLPALVDGEGVVAVPQLNYHREGALHASPGFISAIFRPRQSLSGTGFLVAE